MIRRLTPGVVLSALPLVAGAETPATDLAMLPTTAMQSDAVAAGASPTAAYPTAFTRPDRYDGRTSDPSFDRSSAPADLSTAAAAAAFTDGMPTQDSDSLAVRLKAMEELMTLWDNKDAKIFVGLNDDGHPGIHLRNKK